MLKRIIIFGIIALTYNNLTYGQVSSNSYRQKISSVKNNTNSSIKVFLDSSDYYMGTDRDKSFDFLEKAYLLSLRSNQQLAQKMVLRKLGDFYAHYNQAALAAQNYVKSLSAGPNGDINFFNFVIKAGNQFLLAEDPNSTIEIIDKYYNQSKSSLHQMYMDIVRGDALLKLHKNKKALKAYQLAENKSAILGLTDQNTSIKLKIARVLSASDSEKAISVLNQAKEQSFSNANTTLQIESESEIANFYRDNNQPEKEIVYRENVIKNLDNNKKELESLDYDVNGSKIGQQVDIAKTYNSISQFDNTIEVLSGLPSMTFSDNSNSNGNANPVVKLEDKKTLQLQKEAAKTLSTAYMMTGQKQKALENYKKYVALSEKLFKQKELEYIDINQANRRLRDFQWQIEFLEKDKTLFDSEIQMIKQDRQIQKDKVKFQFWFIIMLATIIILLAIALFMTRKRAKLQKQHNLMLDLKARRSQMNPHFIFNALNSINSFIAKNDELNANKYLSRFSKLMRSVLDNSESDFIPLADEIEMLKLYLELEKMRFSAKFDYEFTIDEELNISEYKIPPMLIQPFVENAIWHGLRYKESGGFLKVKMINEPNILKIYIEDNGIGRKKSMELKTKNQSLKKSKGIENTQERLAILSQLYKQDFQSEIRDAQENGEGVVVELRIPNSKKIN